MRDEKQDIWLVTARHTIPNGTEVFSRKGVLMLPYPMTAFDAADYAVRLEVFEANRMEMYYPHEIHATIWRKRDEGREPGPYQACGALARRDKEADELLRATPWVSENATESVGPHEGTDFLAVEWN